MLGGRETNVESLNFLNEWGGSSLLYLHGGRSLTLATSEVMCFARFCLLWDWIAQSASAKTLSFYRPDRHLEVEFTCYCFMKLPLPVSLTNNHYFQLLVSPGRNLPSWLCRSKADAFGA